MTNVAAPPALLQCRLRKRNTQRTVHRCRASSRGGASEGASAPQRPLLAFTGGGIYYFWQVGVVIALRERLPSLKCCDMSGASAGALSACLAACDVDMQQSVERAYELTVAHDLYRRPGGLAGVWGPLIRTWLQDMLPDDAADMCSGRVTLFTLAMWPPPPCRRVTVSRFEDKDALIDAAMASVHLPYFLDGRATARFKGQRCVDGTLWASRDVVDIRKAATSNAMPHAIPPSSRFGTLLVDHNHDVTIARSRTIGDFVALTTRDGLQRMIDQGYKHMASQLAVGMHDAWIDQAVAAADCPPKLAMM